MRNIGLKTAETQGVMPSGDRNKNKLKARWKQKGIDSLPPRLQIDCPNILHGRLYPFYSGNIKPITYGYSKNQIQGIFPAGQERDTLLSGHT